MSMGFKKTTRNLDFADLAMANSGGSGKLDRKVCFLSEALPG
jgi:hypothetical protein